MSEFTLRCRACGRFYPYSDSLTHRAIGDGDMYGCSWTCSTAVRTAAANGRSLDDVTSLLRVTALYPLPSLPENWSDGLAKEIVGEKYHYFYKAKEELAAWSKLPKELCAHFWCGLHPSDECGGWDQCCICDDTRFRPEPLCVKHNEKLRARALENYERRWPWHTRGYSLRPCYAYCDGCHSDVDVEEEP